MKNILFITFSILFISCSEDNSQQKKLTPALDENLSKNEAYAELGYLTLSEYGFFIGDLAELNPNESVFPYELNTPLFTDYAQKARFIYLPDSSQIDYREGEVLNFPLGTTLIKNFYYSGEQLDDTKRKIIETRLLIHQEEGWVALPYIWNKEQSEAYLEITGGSMDLSITTENANLHSFAYGVPTMNQCKSCHEKDGKIIAIGPSVRQLNRDGQLEKMIIQGKLVNAPEAEQWPKLAQWDNTDYSVDERARAYLDINCAHCHSDGGPAKNSGLSLSYDEVDPFALGVYKKPVAAGKGSGGFAFDINPGNPDESILLHRMKINDPGTQMPELGRSLVHAEGVELIEIWIREMK